MKTVERAHPPVLWTPGKRLSRSELAEVGKLLPGLLPRMSGAAVAVSGRYSSDIQQAVVGVVVANAQSAAISTANILATSHPQGIYQADVIALITTAGNVVNLTVTIGWTDDAQAETVTTANLAANALGQQNTLYGLHSTGGAAITYATALSGAIGAGRYGLAIVLSRLV